MKLLRSKNEIVVACLGPERRTSGTGGRRGAATRVAIKVAPAALAAILGHPGDSGAMLPAENVVDIFGEGLPCQWSPVVSIGDLCTGAYVGNGLVVTAGHCIEDVNVAGGPGNPTAFTFTDTAWNADYLQLPSDPPEFVASAVRCRAHSGSLEPDIGWCELDNIPIAV